MGRQYCRTRTGALAGLSEEVLESKCHQLRVAQRRDLEPASHHQPTAMREKRVAQATNSLIHVLSAIVESLFLCLTQPHEIPKVNFENP